MLHGHEKKYLTSSDDPFKYLDSTETDRLYKKNITFLVNGRKQKSTHILIFNSSEQANHWLQTTHNSAENSEKNLTIAKYFKNKKVETINAKQLPRHNRFMHNFSRGKAYETSLPYKKNVPCVVLYGKEHEQLLALQNEQKKNEETPKLLSDADTQYIFNQSYITNHTQTTQQSRGHDLKKVDNDNSLRTNTLAQTLGQCVDKLVEEFENIHGHSRHTQYKKNQATIVKNLLKKNGIDNILIPTANEKMVESALSTMLISNDDLLHTNDSKIKIKEINKLQEIINEKIKPYINENNNRKTSKKIKKTEGNNNSHTVLNWQLGGIAAGAIIGGAIGFIGGPVGAALGAAVGGWLGGLGGLIIGINRDKKPKQSNNKINSNSDEPLLQATNDKKNLLKQSAGNNNPYSNNILNQNIKQTQSLLNENTQTNQYQNDNNSEHVDNKNILSDCLHANNALQQPQLITQNINNNETKVTPLSRPLMQ